MKINPFLFPDFGIPYAPTAVSVSIINTTVTVAGPPAIDFYALPLVGMEYLVAPSCKFLVSWWHSLLYSHWGSLLCSTTTQY